MILAGRTFADHHHGYHAAGLLLPVQNASGQDFNSVASSVCCPTLKTGWARIGLSAFSIFHSRRLPSTVADKARGVLRPLPASLAALFNHIADTGRQTRRQLSRFPVWRASRCLPVKKITQRQHQLPASVRAPLHPKVLSSIAGFDVSEATATKGQASCLIPTKRLPQ